MSKKATDRGREALRRQVSPSIRLVTVRQLAAATGDGVSTIWQKVKDGVLPKPFIWNSKAVWREPDIEQLIAKAAGVKGKE